jgi:hypothetical protein
MIKTDLYPQLRLRKSLSSSLRSQKGTVSVQYDSCRDLESLELCPRNSSSQRASEEDKLVPKQGNGRGATMNTGLSPSNVEVCSSLSSTEREDSPLDVAHASDSCSKGFTQTSPP